MKQVGDTYYATVVARNANGVLTDPDTLTLRVRDPEGTVTTYIYETDDIIVRDATGTYHADVLLDAAGMWAIDWVTTDEAEVEGVQVAVSPAPTVGITFATLDQLAIRKGMASAEDMTAAQRAQGQMDLELATGQIVSAVGKTAAWAATLDPVPSMLTIICLAAAARAGQNVAGASSETESESLGAYSYSQTTRYESSDAQQQGGGLLLTKWEKQECRTAVHGIGRATTMPATTVDLLVELRDTGELVEFPAPS
jgi:hypothetical protein